MYYEVVRLSWCVTVCVCVCVCVHVCVCVCVGGGGWLVVAYLTRLFGLHDLENYPAHSILHKSKHYGMVTLLLGGGWLGVAYLTRLFGLHDLEITPPIAYCTNLSTMEWSHYCWGEAGWGWHTSQDCLDSKILRITPPTACRKNLSTIEWSYYPYGGRGVDAGDIPHKTVWTP